MGASPVGGGEAAMDRYSATEAAAAAVSAKTWWLVSRTDKKNKNAQKD